MTQPERHPGRMDRLLARIDTEVAAGRPWRAKEIIRGNIANAWPDAAVIERYGQILLSLGDHLEAGKYLWLSGVRLPPYKGAMALFLSRQSRQHRERLLAQLPKSMRRVAFDQLPAELRRDLSTFGVRPDDFGIIRSNRPTLAQASRWQRFMMLTLGLGFLICVIVGAVVGFRTILNWIAQALR